MGYLAPSMKSRGALYILISAAAFGTMAVIAHRAQAAGLSVPTLMLLRFGIATALLGAAAAVCRERCPRGKDLWRLILMGAGLYFGQSLTFFTALRYIPAATASLLLYLYPVFVTVLAVLFFGERLGKRKVFALGLALIGTVLTIGKIEPGNGLGYVYGVVSAALYAAYIIVGSRGAGQSGPFVTTAVVMGATTLSYAVMNLAVGVSPVSGEGLAWGASLAMVSVIAVGGFLAGLASVSPVDASVLSALEPIVTAALAAVILGQALSPTQYAGGAVVLAAVVLLVTSTQRRPSEREVQ